MAAFVGTKITIAGPDQQRCSSVDSCVIDALVSWHVNQSTELDSLHSIVQCIIR